MDQYGGAQIHIRDLSIWLKKQGHMPYVLSGLRGKVSDFIERKEIKYKEIPDLQRAIQPLRDIKAFWQIRKSLKQIKPDIVSCHSSKAGLLGRLACASLGIPVVFTAHGWAFTDNVPEPQKTIYKTIEKLAACLSTHIITVSDFDRDLALTYKIAKPEKMTAINNGVMNISELSPNNHSLENIVRLIMVARFGPQKDHETLIKALARIKDMNWQLDLVGGGDSTEIVKLVENYNLAEKIKFLGEREDISSLLSQSDIYCLISHWEGFPRSILEAMRAGLPVIATNVAGVKESVNDGNTGFCIPHQDEEILADKISYLIQNPDIIKSMGKNARESFENHFTFEHMAQNTINIYEMICKEP
jgi:glycosyltransferase involved in cell wall biosynthesis